MALFVFILVFLVIDAYVFQAVINVSKDWSPLWKQIFRYGYWLPTAIAVLGLLWWSFSDPYRGTDYLRIYVLAGSAILYFLQLFLGFFFFLCCFEPGVCLVFFPIFSKK